MRPQPVETEPRCCDEVAEETRCTLYTRLARLSRLHVKMFHLQPCLRRLVNQIFNKFGISKMATGLDVVAGALGIIGVSQQLAHSARKVKAFCRDVKDAPTDLQELTESLLNLSRILTRIADITATAPEAAATTNVDILRESLRACQDAAERISPSVLESRTQLSKGRHRASCAWVLKRKEVRIMQEKLDRSTLHLSTAFSVFAYAATMHQLANPCMGRDPNLGQQIQTIGQDGADSLLPVRRIHSKAGGSSAAASLRVVLPHWMCEYSWAAIWQRAAGKWTFSLKAFRTLEPGGPALSMCLLGDVDGIRRMLEANPPTLSIHDECPAGYTLYAVSCLTPPFIPGAH